MAPRAGCPSSQCVNGYENRQGPLSDGLVEELEGRGVNDADGLFRCNYCGCVYKPSTSYGARKGEEHLIRGFWRDDEWHPRPRLFPSM